MARREGGSKSNDVDEAMRKWHERGVGTRLYDAFTVAGLRVDAIEPGRALFSFTVPPRLTVCMDQPYQPILFHQERIFTHAQMQSHGNCSLYIVIFFCETSSVAIRHGKKKPRWISAPSSRIQISSTFF
jgi:hypothetical protein